MAKRNKGINIFRNVPQAKLPRTRFNMSHPVKFSGDFGLAYPFFFQDVIAGDTWSVACDHFARLSPMVAPILHQLDVRMHWFFVPTRLLWEDFEDWITGGSTGTWREENPDAFPVFQLSHFAVHPDRGLLNEFTTKTTDAFIGSLWDFQGLNFSTDRMGATPPAGPALRGSDWKFSVLPTRAYWLIFNYFFRDQNVQPEVEIPLTSGIDNMEWLEAGSHVNGLFRVAWDKDYFTSCTLTPQRGPQVYVPIGSTAPVTIGQAVPTGVGAEKCVSVAKPDSIGGAPQSARLLADGLKWTNNNTKAEGYLTSGDEGWYTQLRGTADLSSSSGTPIDDIREGFALQRFFERMQITGSRFSEFLRGIFGTNAGDARLQMPEYLGSWSNPFIINNVSNTTGTAENPQAGYAGNGLSAQFNEPIVKNFPEPGYLIGIYVAMPRNGYQQGVSKMLTRTDWLDWFNPYFEHIGEQPVMASELFFNPTISTVNDAIFGYQSQYASYKFINGHSHGKMKKSLDFWHCNREFTTMPTLSAEFIEYNKSEATDRVFTLVDEDKFFVELNISAFADRPMSVFSTPKLI